MKSGSEVIAPLNSESVQADGACHLQRCGAVRASTCAGQAPTTARSDALDPIFVAHGLAQRAGLPRLPWQRWEIDIVLTTVGYSLGLVEKTITLF